MESFTLDDNDPPSLRSAGASHGDLMATARDQICEGDALDDNDMEIHEDAQYPDPGDTPSQTRILSFSYSFRKALAI